MLITVIIPCYNEKNTISKIVDKIISLKNINLQVIVVDDFSNDGTREILKENISKKVDKIIYHEKNRGKGAAIKSSIDSIKGNIIIIQDADLEYDPNEYEKLIKPILANKADVVFGSRFQGAEPHRVVYFWHRVGNGFLTLLSNIMTDINLTDMETCYKAFRTEILKSINIREKRFGFEPEITAKVARMNCRIYEVGISYYGRTYEEGKKIGWKDGIRAIWCILKYNL